jgi:hypothetical protein
MRAWLLLACLLMAACGCSSEKSHRSDPPYWLWNGPGNPDIPGEPQGSNLQPPAQGVIHN